MVTCSRSFLPSEPPPRAKCPANVSRCWEMHQRVGERTLWVSAPRENDEDSFTICSVALDTLGTMHDRWLNDDRRLKGIFRSITAVMLKTMLIKQHILGIRHRLSSSSTVLDLLNEFGMVVLEIVASGEVVFFSDMSTTALSMPALLCYNVSRMLQTPC